MSIFVRDIETRSTVDLKKVGIHVYSTHPTTEVLCVAYCVNTKDPKIWVPGMPVPKEYGMIAEKKNATAVAHNVTFEMGIERNILGPKFKFPLITVEKNFCTQIAACAMALPPELGKCLAALNLKYQKDVVGRRTMLQVTKPRKPKKGEDPNAVLWHDDKERLERVYQYCINDALSERDLYHKLAPLLPAEFDLWLLDQKINERGFYVDRELLEAAKAVAEQANEVLNEEMVDVTKGAVTAVTEVARLQKWLRTQKVETKTLDKEDIELLLARPRPPAVKRALELRLMGAQAAAKKIDAMLMRRQPDGRLRGSLLFHKAGTGRWASQGAQVHNMKRLPDDFDVDAAIEVIKKKSYREALKTYPNPLEVIGTLSRPMIRSAPKKILWGADFSGIEARVTAWLAGEETKLEIFRKYDAGVGPDPYIVTAADILRKAVELITKMERQKYGKPPELAFGFQGGLNAFKKFSSDFTDDEIEEFKKIWRAKHPKIVKLWYNLNDQTRECVRTGQEQGIEHSKLLIRANRTAKCGLSVMTITLPSGRDIVYPDARIYTPQDGKPDQRTRGLHFMDNTQGQWKRVRVYGGLICENVVQGTARDLLAHVMTLLDKAGFGIVMHVHDEVVVEEPAGSKRFDQFKKLMNQMPRWSLGLPVVAKAWQAERYVK